VLLTFGVAAVVLTAFTVLFERPALLWLPRNRPVIWGIVMIAYPLLSVYPQEVIYRAFLFHRYRHVFPTAPGRLCISALAFALVHIVFHNNVALVLSLAGGFLFALTYHRTRSLAVVWLEHALYGCLIFTVGLGTRFFYQGSLRAAEDTARTYTESR
jgi:membrane protease YdiL (CAAX protease family)